MRKPRLLTLMLSAVLSLAPSSLEAQTSAARTDPAPQGFKLAKVQYIMLGVGNLSASAAFYERKLGLKTTLLGDDVVFVDAGSVTLVLSTAVAKTPGDSEIVFGVEHVQTAYNALTRANIEFARKPHAITASSWAATFRDPDGHLLSLYGPQ